MTISLVQSVHGTGATLVLNGVAAGNTLFVLDSYFRSPGTGVAAATPTDSNGTFTIGRAGIPANFVSGGNNDCGIGIWYQENALAGTHTVTPEALTSHEGTLLEFSGLITSSSLDQVNDAKTNDSTQTSQVTGTTPATTVADELVLIGLCLGAAAGVADVGFTDPVAGFTTLFKRVIDSSGLAFMHSYKIISATGTQAATFNWTDNEAHQGSHGAIATFKATTAAGGLLSIPLTLVIV